MSAVAQDEFRTGTLAAANDVVELAQPGTATVMVQLVVTGTNTTVFEVNVDQGASPNWVAVNAQNVNTGASVSSATASGIYRVDVSAAREFRVRSSAWTSGSAVVSMNGSVAPSSAASGVSSSSGTVVDTELPPAAAASDAYANPTAPSVLSHGMAWNGATWDRLRMASASAFDLRVAIGGTGGATDATTNAMGLPIDSAGAARPLGVANLVWGATAWERARAATADSLAATGIPASGLMVWNGTTWDRVKGSTTSVGLLRVAAGITLGSIDGQSNTISGIQEESGGGRPIGAANYAHNGTTWDRLRVNEDRILLASALRNATSGPTALVTYNHRAVYFVLDTTVHTGSGIVKLVVDFIDPASGKAVNLLTGANVSSATTNTYKIGIGLTAAANVTVVDYLARNLQWTVTLVSGTSVTYSLGCCLMAA